MAILLSAQSISKSFGARPLFRDISFSIADGDRAGIIGPNGSGKSTLLRLLAGEDEPDEGLISSRKLLRLAYVPQSPEFPEGRTVRELLDSVAAGAHFTDEERAGRIEEALGRAGFTDASMVAQTLSGGWRKRLAIAQALLTDPELLLLDEPTNHLDLEGILWLEKLLQSAPFASLVISHDRYFLENVATRMIEINRAYPQGLLSSPGNYSDFLIKKDDFLIAQTKRQESLENRLRREVEWLRRGAKARTSKSKARIDAAGRLTDEVGELAARTASRATQIDFTGTDRRTKRLLETEGISKELGGKPLFKDLSLVLSPGTRLGLLGPNGSGKSTLLRILAGEIEPDSGSIRRADALRVLYFDQDREQLDPAVPLRRALAPEGDSVIFQGRPIHVAGWAARFLFGAEQLELPVAKLSGGEQARVLIARLMLQPADILLLDEPTNDLDIPTLEALEETLLEFAGALVLVTHDRYLLDRVSTRIVGLDGAGNAGLYAETAQWESEVLRNRPETRKKPPAPQSVAAPLKTVAPRKLSYLEKIEWENIEAKIMAAEAAARSAETEMSNPEGMADASVMQARYDALVAAQSAVEFLYARWAELEEKLAG